MPRTVVPPVRVRGANVVPGTGDGLPEKLVKYVPAETLAFFVPISAGIGSSRPGVLWVILAAATVITVGYLWWAAQKAETEEKPRPHFYVLAVLAFLAWALGTNAAVAGLIGLDGVWAGVILGIAVFLVPLADIVLNKVIKY